MPLKTLAANVIWPEWQVFSFGICPVADSVILCLKMKNKRGLLERVQKISTGRSSDANLGYLTMQARASAITPAACVQAQGSPLTIFSFRRTMDLAVCCFMVENATFPTNILTNIRIFLVLSRESKERNSVPSKEAAA